MTGAEWEWGGQPAAPGWHPVLYHSDPEEGMLPGAVLGPYLGTVLPNGGFCDAVGPVQATEDAALDWAHENEPL